MGYHHGDLPAALIRTSFEVLADCGLRRFSVAAVARRAGVSSAAPYRHFPDRDHLLSAVSGVAARELREAIEAAGSLAEAAGAYVRYVARTGAGFHVIFAPELYAVPDDERREQTRALMTTLIDLAGDVSYERSLHRVEATIAVAHGFTSLFADGFYTKHTASVEDIAARAVAAATLLD
ncbi:TetR/AcrR family transcriptional regulator [Actinoplanes solisilvae]|uniref:TetR/AcrR family transcriptional regulator n=1 Tax=Actinoplanes solisilvae TaxID=2486853 RepID=UPI000FDB57E4|nr:helix-turn-helix domain-containing protein [Actinoplanes solisilvae]